MTKHKSILANHGYNLVQKIIQKEHKTMAKYGIHTCLYMEENITIDKWGGDWYMTLPVENLDTDETTLNEYKIRYCPFCGEDLEDDSYG